MFDIGWSEMVVIGVVALIAIGPKELPGVLRMVGQWIGKARRMASDFQGQFNEAMREAEMADLKKSFDDVADAAKGFSSGNILSSVTKDVEDALKIDQPVMTPTTPEPPTPQTFIEAETHAPEVKPSEISSQITSEVTSEIAPPVVPHDLPESGKAS
ncbi:Sec-independent protein translocase protein TatB [Bradyrhizobium prioriisuperbiae]|uniref:Sec-independent protein translocase protein TatB n=1 Tax=Bradyrhizobium prioriisuperbiae TaxID=2854389 RepID=UPI0028E8005A|nr:Sec-independent protein translocase protein TatB [Bradyrhizobium prioritasuperba]